MIWSFALTPPAALGKTGFRNFWERYCAPAPWFAPLRQSLHAAAESLASQVNGEVVLELYKGRVTAIQKKSPNSLYSEEFATFGEDEVYDHSHAGGFIRLFSLSSRIRALNEQKK